MILLTEPADVLNPNAGSSLCKKELTGEIGWLNMASRVISVGKPVLICSHGIVELHRFQ
jgi:hypothetical protein